MRIALLLYMLITEGMSTWSDFWMYDLRGNCLPEFHTFCTTQRTPDNPMKTAPELEAASNLLRYSISYSLYVPDAESVRTFGHRDLETKEPPEFDTNIPTKILINGLRLSKTPNDKLKDVYLKYKQHNVITVDWASGREKILYPLQADGAFLVGFCVFQMMDIVFPNPGSSLYNVHIIGHSVGSHAAGYAGRLLQKVGHRTLGRITGLDAANPNAVDGLLSEDAVFVDVIHTNAENLGDFGIIGDADFYPNGGQGNQPGCNKGYPPYPICNTLKAYDYFEETVRDPHKYLTFRCEDPASLALEQCDGESAYMGDGVDTNARGKYYAKFSDV